MSRPPWIRPAEPLFKEVKTYVKPKVYNTYKWQQQSGKYFRGKKCAKCIRLAYCTDHIIPIEQGGATWDKRNWQPMCKPCHDRKRGREAHGYCEPSIDTPTGKVPERNQHLPPDIAGESYLVK